MNGVTGRMGLNQHLGRSIGDPEAGRRRLNDARGDSASCPADWTQRLEARSDFERVRRALFHRPRHALADEDAELFFDAQTTDRRVPAAEEGDQRGQAHLLREADVRDVRRGDGSLPGGEEGGREARRRAGQAVAAWDDEAGEAARPGFFGKILSVRGEFGYWVFEGDTVLSAQRPSWNYRKEDGGGIIIDMLCHWRYVLDNLFGNVKAVSCMGAIHVPERIDEKGKKYACTADDSAYATFEFEGKEA